MLRNEIVNRIGREYLTANIENDEYSYVKEAGSKTKLAGKVGHEIEHFNLDRRFEYNDQSGRYVILVETKQNFVDGDEMQLASYLEEEQALHKGRKIICILANTADDKIKVWKSDIDDKHLLKNETVIDSMTHYVHLFVSERQNNREAVMHNTYALNELLHKRNIDENKRSQFVGTCLLFVKNQVERFGHGGYINDKMNANLTRIWETKTPTEIRSGIASVLDGLLTDTDKKAAKKNRIGTTNKTKKIELLQKNVLGDQHVKELKLDEWVEILSDILMKIYRYIDDDSAEGQDILNLFFITFNKYTGKADKNQAFTPDHITDFMCRVTGVNKDSRVLDPCCGSGSFLVQAMVKELADCRFGHTEAEYETLSENVKYNNIYGIECEEKAYGLSTTNMLIHSDGNSNIELGSCFDKKDFIKQAKPDIILMNPPYNAKPKNIPSEYKSNWTKKEQDGKEDPTKGLVFVKYLSDIAEEDNWHGTKLAVLLPMSAAIGTSKRVAEMKEILLQKNTLEAVFTLPAEIFYPGAAVQACCMVFTLNQPHFDADGEPNKNTFFGYYKEDGFKKKKNLGRVEQFDADGHSKWRDIEKEWLNLYKNKTVKAGMSTMHAVSGDDEWLCEAYMETDYSKLTEADFQQTINNFLAYLVKEGKVYES